MSRYSPFAPGRRWRRTALTVLLAFFCQLVAPMRARASDKEFDTVLSGLPILPEKANEPFDSLDDGDSTSAAARENKYSRMPLRVFLSLMAKPEGMNVTLVPLNLPLATLQKPLGIILRNLKHTTRAILFGDIPMQILPVKYIRAPALEHLQSMGQSGRSPLYL